jgi:hypothetical protein
MGTRVTPIYNNPGWTIFALSWRPDVDLKCGGGNLKGGGSLETWKAGNVGSLTAPCGGTI